MIHSCSLSNHSKGVCILLAKDLPCKVISTHRDGDGRIILINIELNNIEYSICNIYCSNNVSDRIAFLQYVNEFVKSHAVSGNRILIGGDFNCADSPNDRSHKIVDRSSAKLANLKSSLHLEDVWRHFNPNTIEYSYIDPSSRGFNSRIDLWLGSRNIVSDTVTCVMRQAPTPDHKAIFIAVKVRHNTRGKGYWKMNNSVINEENYREGISELFDDTLEEYGEHVPKSVLWEYLKIKIKEFTISYCIARSHSKKQLIKDLEDKIDAIDRCNENFNCQKDLERKQFKQQLDNLYEITTKGYHVRSRAKWVESGEKSTGYFVGLEKSRQSANCITSLRDTNGKSQVSDKEILNVATDFYTQLYQSNASIDGEIDRYVEAMPRENLLDDLDRLECEGLISLEENTIAVGKMKHNKSPGLDGITTEFYQAFWPLLGNLLTEVFNESYESGFLPDSQRKAVMTLSYKKGNEDDIANYRPSSLTNVDYRILAFILAQRMQKVMDKIICNDQSAYIKGRYMGTNIRLVSDIIDYYDTTDKSGILLMLDFKKAFDSIEMNFLLKSLEYFNFDPSFIRWIQTIYHRPSAYIKNNGHISETFNMSRGIRQGCPVSALLFIICVEILAKKVRNSETLAGFNFGYPQKPIKINQYADDGIMFLNNRTELCSALAILRDFGRVSGLKLNIEKCEGFWLGRNKKLQHNCKLCGIKWPSIFKCLGIYLGYNRQLNETKNWDEKIQDIENTLKKWEKRDLTLFGRVQVLRLLHFPN